MFLQDIDLHVSIAERTVWVQFSGEQIPVISAEDLVLCKIAYNRPRDWEDIRTIFLAQSEALDRAYLESWLYELFPEDDERIRRYRETVRGIDSNR